ncbi:MAG TPA: hypothetical protein VGF02_03935 [Pseudolabrys sp.]
MPHKDELKQETIAAHGALMLQMKCWHGVNAAVFFARATDPDAIAGFARQLQTQAENTLRAAKAIYSAAKALQRPEDAAQ